MEKLYFLSIVIESKKLFPLRKSFREEFSLDDISNNIGKSVNIFFVNSMLFDIC